MLRSTDEERKAQAMAELFPNTVIMRSTPIPTQAQVFELCGTTRQIVRRVSKEGDGRAHGLSIGLDRERALLAAYARECNAQGQTVFVRELTDLLRQFLQLRHDAGGQQLNRNEMRLIEEPHHQLSQDFWAAFTTEHGLARSAPRNKKASRIDAYTVSVVKHWQGKLWATLEAEGFLIKAGQNKGHIRPECK